jgi:tetratricopeptide (TPR) repeat protein
MVLGQRNDIMTLDQEKLTYGWYYEQVKERFPSIVLRGERYDGVNTLNLHLIGDNMHHEAVCFRNFKEDSYEKAFQALPMGLVKIMLPKHQAFPVEKLEGHVNRFYANFKKRGWQRDFPLTSIEHTIKTFYAEPFACLAHEFHRAGKLEKAAQYYRMALDIDPNQLPSLKNLAMLYLKKMKPLREAVDLLARYIELNPDDKDAERIRQIIKMHER